VKKLALIYLLLLIGLQLAFAQSSPRHFLSAANSNSTLVFSAKAILQAILVTNTNATTYYLKIYDKATAPVCGTDTPVLTIPVPENVPTGISGVSMLFTNGVGFCLTGGIADSDDTPAATGVAIDLSVSGR
jgi:hypothetical protein